MVPATCVEVAALPLTPDGKVNRAALPAPDGARADPGAAFVEPRTEAERILAGIWAQVLGVERVGVENDFFDLGGHSLLATQVICRVRDEFGVDLPLAALFDDPTIARFTATVVASAGRRRYR